MKQFTNLKMRLDTFQNKLNIIKSQQKGQYQGLRFKNNALH